MENKVLCHLCGTALVIEPVNLYRTLKIQILSKLKQLSKPHNSLLTKLTVQPFDQIIIPRKHQYRIRHQLPVHPNNPLI